jgi:CDP-diacylglycerol--serine O-phosphatidyltransferase
VYLICGAFRLARFNCLASMPDEGKKHGSDFVGFPIPAAAGLVSSLTLFLLWWNEKFADFRESPLRYVLPVILVFLSVMMVSQVRYPSFKKLDWRARGTFPKMVVTVLLVGLLVIARKQVLPWLLPILFTTYLLYGFVRPKLSRRMVREIEDADADEEPEVPPGAAGGGMS